MKMNDQETSVAELRQLVRKFVEERRWQVFHNPKNLAMSLSIEVAELMEHFQWLTAEEASRVHLNAEEKEAIGEEIADVLAYTCALANVLQIDLSDTLQRKMKKNAKKYPVELARGKWQRPNPEANTLTDGTTQQLSSQYDSGGDTENDSGESASDEFPPSDTPPL